MRIHCIALTASSTLAVAAALAFTPSSSLHSTVPTTTTTTTAAFASHHDGTSRISRRRNRLNVPLHMTEESSSGSADTAAASATDGQTAPPHDTVDEYRTGLKQIGNRASKPTVSE